MYVNFFPFIHARHFYYLTVQSQNVLTYEEEHARRKTENTARELWYFLNSQLKKLEKSDGEWSSKISTLEKELEGYRRLVLRSFVLKSG